MAYGEPRFTQDLDIVIRIHEGDIADFVTAIRDSFHHDEDDIREGVRRQGLFQLLDLDTMVKIDFHVGEAIPGELSRSREETVLGGATIPLPTPEDTILSKLLWLKKGSFKSREDVIGILSIQKHLDFAYLSEMSRSLGVEDLFIEVRREAEEKAEH